MRRVWSSFMAIVLLSGTMPSALLAQGRRAPNPDDETTTPVKHLVVIFDENNSFDHYFGTYPVAANPGGEPVFYAMPDTPKINGLTDTLKNANPNPVAPFRLDRSQAMTCDNDNHYKDEQEAENGGLLDEFAITSATPASTCGVGLNMGYYDGNTVTALWNYAQHFAMSDNFFDTEFGTTVMGHINLISGQTHQSAVTTVSGKVANGSIIANIDPVADDCSSGATIQMTGLNVGDLLNNKGVSWGWFYGDFTAASITGGIAACTSEYDGHYDPFLYYASTTNPHHTQPASVAEIGYAGQANHQYDLNAFWAAVQNGNLPAVSFVKPPHADNGHPSDSTPLLEQTFLVNTINRLQESPNWKDMAIIITYDDSDGWYDHVMPPIVNHSNDPANDALLGATGLCSGGATLASGAYLDRCGYGERLPFLVISPYARHNYVDSATNDLTSVLRFIEDNWGLGRIGDQSFDAIAGSIQGMFNFEDHRERRVILDPDTGTVIRCDE
jgi:phospholipase C